MTNPNRAAELAGRLNAHVSKFGQGTGGVSEFTESDIAGAIGLLKHERERLWVRVIYSGHERFRQDLDRHLLMTVVDYAAPRRWKISESGTLGALIEAAVTEVTDTTVCNVCKGQRSVILGPDAGELAGKSVTCETCKGRGYDRKSDRWRYSRVQIHHKLWRRHWRERYEDILGMVRVVDDRAKSALAGRMG